MPCPPQIWQRCLASADTRRCISVQVLELTLDLTLLYQHVEGTSSMVSLKRGGPYCVWKDIAAISKSYTTKQVRY